MSSLTPADLETFAYLGISPELLEAAHIERVTDEQARNDFGITGTGNMEGIVFPYLNGDGRRSTCRLRRDHPEIENGKPKNKYVAPYGDVRHLYFPPNAEGLLENTETSIIFVEAEKSALAITAWAARDEKKVVAIGTGGCWAWRGTIGKTTDANGARVDEKGPLPELACVKDHPVIILFDANTATNPKVDAARFAFAEALKKLGAVSITTPNLPTRGNPNVNGPDDFLREYGDRALAEVLDAQHETKIMDSFSVSALFAAREQTVDFLTWPLLAPGLSVVLDALPKDGKSVLLFRGVLAARRQQTFLGHATHPVRVLYVSEQSAASLGMQLRECGFAGDEPVEELRFIPREVWCRYVFDDFVRTLEKDFLPGNYNALVFDTFATVARLEDEKDAAEINRCANLILDVASRHALALCIGRHDRKSGGDIGVSGRGSGQLSGLVDLILHLTRVPGDDRQRKLETRGRIPGLPTTMKIELMPNGQYVNWGAPAEPEDRAAQVAEWYAADTNLTTPQVVEMFAALTPPQVIPERTARRWLADAKAAKS